jgi:hypothetical protein
MADLSVITTHKLDVITTIGPRVGGEDCVWLLPVPIGSLPNFNQAIDRALEKTSKETLLDTVMYSSVLVTPLGGRACFGVHGIPAQKLTAE